MTDLLPYQLLPTAWIVGWTLVHFIWQAALLAALASFALTCVDRRGSSARYLVCALSLACMAAAPVITMFFLATAPAVDVPSLALTSLVIAPDLRQRISLLVPGFTVAWLAGVWVMQVRIVAQLIGARGLARTGIRPLDEPLAGMVRSLCSQLGLRHVVNAYQSSRAAVPMVVGWMRPVVLVPTAAIAGLSTGQLRAVLAHELAHIKRHDALVNLAQSIFESLFFFHPAVWWLSNRLRVEREFCCDDIAVATCGDPLTYAKALATLDDVRSVQPAAALAATGGSLMQRITRLLDSGRAPRRIGGWLAPMIMTLSLTAVVSAMSFTDDEKPDASAALKGVDLVEVVAPVDGELAEILGILRQGGMDDATLLEFVTRLGTSPEVVTAIQAATERAVLKQKHIAIKERVSKAHDSIKTDVEEGLITKEEAKLRMEALHRDVEQQVAELGNPSGNTFLLRRGNPQILHVGENAKLKVLHEKTKQEVAELKHKLHGLHEEVVSGEKSADEVGSAMEKIQKHIHEVLLRDQEHEAHAQVMLERHPEHDVHFGHGAGENSWPEKGALELKLKFPGGQDGVFEVEPELIEVIEVEPLGQLNAVHHVETRLNLVHPEETEHEFVAAQNVWSTALDEAAVDALHQHYQVPREPGPGAQVAHDHLVKIFTVLSGMQAHLQPETEVALVPLRANVLLDMSDKPTEGSVEWVEEVIEPDDT